MELNFNDKFKEIKLREMLIWVFVAFLITIIFGYIFPIVDQYDDLLVIISDGLIILFFVLKMRKSLKDLSFNASEVFKKANLKEILFVVFINIFFAFAILIGIDVLVNLGSWIDLGFFSDLNESSVGFIGPFTFIPLILDFLSSVFFAPVAEELIFRGVLLNRFRNRIGLIPAILVPSICFGFCHDFGGILSAILFGICMCILYLKTDNILINIFAHALNNFIICILTYIDPNDLIFTCPWVYLIGSVSIISVILMIQYLVKEFKFLRPPYI